MDTLRTRSRSQRRPVTVEPVAPEHPFDRAIRLRDRSLLPDGEFLAFDAVLTAFDQYEAGEDAAARESLSAVGLGSPFLEWKLLLRGLMAYSTGDDVRARENFHRLDTTRLPARLAAPVRALIDPEFHQVTSDAVRSQASLITAGRLTEGLKKIGAEFARGKSLATAFRQLDAVLPQLKARSPAIVERLANCFYRAILAHGEAADLPRYRRAFGPPQFDPEFHRLQALIFEGMRNLEATTKQWTAYEHWLATTRLPWSTETIRQARALILHHLGCLAAEDADNAPDHEIRELMMAFLGPDRTRGLTSPSMDPVPFWRRAVELAPGWEPPAQDLFHFHLDAMQPEKAEAVARRILEVNPAAVSLMGDLANLLFESGRPREALEVSRKRLVAHPLDQSARMMVAMSTVAAARQMVIERNLKDAMKILDDGDRISRAELPACYLAFRAVLARALKRPDESATLQAEAQSLKNGNLVSALIQSVDGMLARLPLVERKDADLILSEVWTRTATPGEIGLLIMAWDHYQLAKITYRGQKTQEKKLRDLMLRSVQTKAPELDFETLARSCLFRNDLKLLTRLTTLLRDKFPANPVFPLLQAEARLIEGGGRPGRRMTELLQSARSLATRSTEPRHQDVLDRVREIELELGDSALHPLFR